MSTTMVMRTTIVLLTLTVSVLISQLHQTWTKFPGAAMGKERQSLQR
nr:MAG TPA: hypothetical protein [Caudoviricetes sp.]